jgi:hypothetical protein
VFHGTADEEVSPHRCSELVERSKEDGGDIEIRFYPGATLGFDDPGSKRQSNEANAVATEDAVQRRCGSLPILRRHWVDGRNAHYDVGVALQRLRTGKQLLSGMPSTGCPDHICL